MVERQLFEKAFNVPLWKVRRNAVYWAKQFTKVDWQCHACGQQQTRGSVSFEITTRFTERREVIVRDEQRPSGEQSVTVKEARWFETPIRHYLCLDCGIKMLDEVKTKLEILKAGGPKGYKLVEAL